MTQPSETTYVATYMYIVHCFIVHYTLELQACLNGLLLFTVLFSDPETCSIRSMPVP